MLTSAHFMHFLQMPVVSKGKVIHEEDATVETKKLIQKTVWILADTFCRAMLIYLINDHVQFTSCSLFVGVFLIVGSSFGEARKEE